MNPDINPRLFAALVLAYGMAGMVTDTKPVTYRGSSRSTGPSMSKYRAKRKRLMTITKASRKRNRK